MGEKKVMTKRADLVLADVLEAFNTEDKVQEFIRVYEINNVDTIEDSVLYIFNSTGVVLHGTLKDGSTVAQLKLVSMKNRQEIWDLQRHDYRFVVFDCLNGSVEYYNTIEQAIAKYKLVIDSEHLSELALSVISVDKPFYKKLSSEISIDYDIRGFSIYIAYDRYTDAEIDNFKYGKASISIAPVDKDILFFIFDFERYLGYSDVAFSMLKVNSEYRLEDVQDGYGYMVTFYLVERETNILKAVRVLSVTSKFSNMLNVILRKQVSNTEFDDELYRKKIDNIWSKYSSEGILNEYGVCTCKF